MKGHRSPVEDFDHGLCAGMCCNDALKSFGLDVLDTRRLLLLFCGTIPGTDEDPARSPRYPWRKAQACFWEGEGSIYFDVSGLDGAYSQYCGVRKLKPQCRDAHAPVMLLAKLLHYHIFNSMQLQARTLSSIGPSMCFITLLSSVVPPVPSIIEVMLYTWLTQKTTRVPNDLEK